MPREISAGERWFRRVVKLLLLGAIVGIVVWTWPVEVIQVRTEAVGRGTVEEIVTSIQAGSVKSRREAHIRGVAAGRVAAVHIDKGDRVEKDQLLVELDGASLEARLRLTLANLMAGRSVLRTAEVRRKVARSSLERNSKLAAKGVLSPGALERFQAEFDLAIEAVASADANLAQLRAARDVSQAVLDETRIRAPFAGLVTRVHVELGEMVAPATPLLDLVDDSTVTVEASIDEADLGRIEAGMPVRVETDAYPDRPFAGKLVYISPVVLADLRQNRSLSVEVGLNGTSNELKVGMSADIEIVVDHRDDVLFVPTAAVMRRGDRQQVYVVSAGRARLRTIRSGLTNWERTEVIEGLREGERIVVSLQAPGLADGVEVALEGAGESGRAAY